MVSLVIALQPTFQQLQSAQAELDCKRLPRCHLKAFQMKIAKSQMMRGPYLHYSELHNKGAYLVAQVVKNLPVMLEAWVWSLGWEDPLEKGMATHSSILAWEIPWTEEPGGLQSMRSQSWTHWATNTFTHQRKPLESLKQGTYDLVRCDFPKWHYDYRRERLGEDSELECYKLNRDLGHPVSLELLEGETL